MNKSYLDKFKFLIGDWNLDYIIPESIFSESATDKGVGSFKKILNDQFITFEYSTQSGREANGIFAWDDKLKVYRYWWFENTGSFQTATCNFIREKTLAMNWHDTLLVQTFTRVSSEKVILRMKYPANEREYDLVLEVVMTKK